MAKEEVSEGEIIDTMEKSVGCKNSDKLLYFADMINLAGPKWVQSGPLANPEDQASEKIKAIAEKFRNEPRLTFAMAKAWNNLMIERLGINTSVEEWARKKRAAR